jgi:cation diffusion facilitator CzcD-associated flavoprotein CzcO
MTASTGQTASHPRIAIVGTGFSGLCLGIHLRKSGNDNFVIFEKADRIGGTWRENTYPGAECDIPSALYSFSFERNPRWTHKWSEQPEILRYMEHCAAKYGLEPHIRFHQEVVESAFDEETGDWTVTTADGTEERFNVVVSAIGQLHKPFTPAIKGAESFSGPSFHSARWNHDVSLEGKNVVVIGNAASAIQFIPQIAPKVKKLTVTQRSANWIMEKKDREYWEIEKKLGSLFPALTNLYRFRIWFRGELNVYPLMKRSGDNWYRKLIRKAAIDYIEEKIRDPELRKKLIPDYPIGARRILFSDDIYDALDRDNVDVVTSPIQDIEPGGLRTEDGQLHEADVMIYATGFESTTFLTPWRVTGRGGEVLNDRWDREGAEAYLGITHSGFPNFFMMYGPNTNLGHNSIIVMIEAQTRYILSCLTALRGHRAAWLDVKPEAQEAYNARLQERMQKMIWTAVEKSWYKRDGKVTNNWVGRTTEYIKRTREINSDDYEFACNGRSAIMSPDLRSGSAR